LSALLVSGVAAAGPVAAGAAVRPVAGYYLEFVNIGAQPGPCMRETATAPFGFVDSAACNSGDIAEQWEPTQEGDYLRLRNRRSGQCLGFNLHSEFGARLSDSYCTSGQVDQNWKMQGVYAGSPYFYFVNRASGMCLEDTHYQNEIIQLPCNGSDVQIWMWSGPYS
jgi:hypothetical protein